MTLNLFIDGTLRDSLCLGGWKGYVRITTNPVSFVISSEPGKPNVFKGNCKIEYQSKCSSSQLPNKFKIEVKIP